MADTLTQQANDCTNKKKCCVCGGVVVVANSVRIYDKNIKQKLNDHFGTKCVTTDNTVYFLCQSHWTEFSAKEKKISQIFNIQRPCCVCGRNTNVHSNEAVRINDPQLKGKLNKRFRTHLAINRDVLMVCRFHLMAVNTVTVKEKKDETRRPQEEYGKNVKKPLLFRICDLCGESTSDYRRVNSHDQASCIATVLETKMAGILKSYVPLGIICRSHIRVIEENTVDPNSIELLNSGISTNKQDSKEGIVKVLKEEHQSIDTKEMTIDQLVKDEVINVEQLIGQRYDSVLIDSVHRLNPEILIKEEIIKEEE